MVAVVKVVVVAGGSGSSGAWEKWVGKSCAQAKQPHPKIPS